jgi:DNA replication protein DnaC
MSRLAGLREGLEEAYRGWKAAKTAEAKALGRTFDEHMDVIEAGQRRDQANKDQLEQRTAAMDRFQVRIDQRARQSIIEDRVDNTRAIQAVRHWLKDRRPILVLCGSIGCGKTFAGAFAAAHIGGAEHMSAAELVKSKWGKNPMPKMAAFLLFDDYDTQRGGDAFDESFFELMDARCNVGRTVITSNLSRDEFLGSLSPRLRSRFMHKSVSVDIGGEDRREEMTEGTWSGMSVING